VTGSGFTGAANARFGSVAGGNLNVANDGSLTVTIPAHAAQVVDVTVTAGGAASLAGPADRFTYYTNLAGGLTAAPDASSWGGGRLDVFARGPDGALWHRWRGPQWSAWESLGGALAPNAGVGAVAWAQNRIDVFVDGTDSVLWHRWWDGAKWNGWEPLGGTLTSGPDAASWAAGRLDVFTRGTDSGIWHKWWDGAKWSGWEPLGGTLTGDPGTVSWGPDRIDLFVHGVPDGLYHAWFGGGHWNGWENLGGSLGSGPDPASSGSGVLDVFYLTSDGTIWGRSYSSGWRVQRSLYLPANTAPGAVSSSPGSSDLLARGSGSSLLYTKTAPS
jgi:hypothetical protein